MDLIQDSSMCELSSEPIDKHTSESSDTDDTLISTNTDLYSEPDINTDSNYSPNINIEMPSPSRITLRPRNKEIFSKSKDNQGKGYLCCSKDTPVPLNYNEAITSTDCEKWKIAIEKELDSHRQNGTWILVERPVNAKTIGSKWVFRIKMNQRVLVTKLDCVQKVMHKKKALIMMKHSHQQ